MKFFVAFWKKANFLDDGEHALIEQNRVVSIANGCTSDVGFDMINNSKEVTASEMCCCKDV